MGQCSRCDQALGPVLAESSYWRLILNQNQNLLGKCFLVLRRHLEAVPLLTTDEWLDLHQQLAGATVILRDHKRISSALVMADMLRRHEQLRKLYIYDPLSQRTYN